MKHRPLFYIGIPVFALLMAIAPGLDFAVQKKVLPDAAGVWDLLYQAIARTSAAVSTDRIALAVLFCVALWLTQRYLLHKPQHTGVGEYVLCLFFSGMMLLNRGIRTAGKVEILWENSFQVLKAGLYLIGMFVWFLVGLRALYAVLAKAEGVALKAGLARFVQKQTCASLCLWLGLMWLPHIVIRYPGVLMWDTFHQIKQFLGEFARQNNHPPFGTLLYGLMAQLGLALGNINLGYLLGMLLQVTALLFVLANSLVVMRSYGVRPWIRVGAFALYAISPCYVGWVTVICKDTMYFTLCLQIGVYLMEFGLTGLRFVDKRRSMLGLGVCLTLLCLTRYNGVLVAAPIIVGLLITLLVRRGTRAQWVRVGAVALATAALTMGINEAIIQGLSIQKVYMYDVYSLPFMQTARVVKKHSDQLPADEVQAIDAVLDVSLIGQSNSDWYADAVKDTYRTTATAAQRNAYLRVWGKQLLHYPLDYLNATLSLNGLLFDWQFNRPMYVGLSDSALTDYVYPYSYNDMSLYNTAETQPLNAAQRMLTQWYFSFDSLPLLGLFTTMGFGLDVMLAMLYLSVVSGRKRALWVFIPSLVTAVGCLFVPVAYLRYALPYLCSLPLWFGAYDAARPGVAQEVAQATVTDGQAIPSKTADAAMMLDDTTPCS